MNAIPTPIVERVPCIEQVSCWQCAGDGYVETGYQYESNVGTSRRCGICAGTGFITVEKDAAP